MSKNKALEWYLRGGWVESEQDSKQKLLGVLPGIYVYVEVHDAGYKHVCSDSLEQTVEHFKKSKYKITTPPIGFTNLELALLWSPKYEPQTPPQKSKKARSTKAKQPSRKTRRRIR